MARKEPGDQIFQDFKNAQRPVDVKVEELEKIVHDTRLQKLMGELKDVTKWGPDENYMYKNMQAVLNSTKDTGIIDQVKGLMDNIKSSMPQIKYVVQCGIGGSELGASALIYATMHNSQNQRRNKGIEYFPITSLNNDHIARIIARIDPAKTLVLKATRSNTTMETLTAFDVFAAHLKERLGDGYNENCVAIIGKDKEKEATDAGYHFLGIEPQMSGRFTAFHSANLLTMYAMGVDIDRFHEGGEHMLKKCVEGSTLDSNPALEQAANIYLLNTTRGKMVLNAGVFSPDLVKYGDWLGQLIEESLVHRKDIALLTKTSELSNKAHSYMQGWLEGANVYLHQFVFPIGNHEKEIIADKQTGRTLTDTEFAEYKGIATSLANAGRPSYTTILSSINENALGQMMARDMVTTMMLGELYGLRKEFIGGKVTDFGYLNQPGVEAYKIVMKGELKSLGNLQEQIADVRAGFE
ncbi:hypothetical protein GF323_05025 [Candidatus Woesearchaeota archaeon]|nr:hypothetical protein [Candidatus Woesearchaeota archaeon]